MNRRTLALVIAVITFTVGIVVAKLSLPRTQHQEPVNHGPGSPDKKTLDSGLNSPVSDYQLTGHTRMKTSRFF